MASKKKAAKKAKGKTSKQFENTIRKAALGYPEAIEDFPWGHSAFKVNKKIFVSMANDGEGLRMSFKLPESRYEALTLPFTEPTHYGMGKHGWVTAKFDKAEQLPMDLLLEWMEESYRKIAPKRLVKVLDGDLAEGA